MSIIVIDDHVATTRVIQKMLELKGFQNVYVFSNAEDALEFLGLGHQREGKCNLPEIDLILTDVNMPQMSGIELCKRIKQHEQLADIPIIILTAYDDEQSLQEAFRAGAADYLRKPFNLTELEVRVRQAVNQKRMIAELKQATEISDENYQLYKSLFNNNSDSCFLLDLQGYILEVNDAATALIGYSKFDLVNLPIYNIIIDEDSPLITQMLQEAIAGKTTNSEIISKHKSGKTAELSITMVPVKIKERVEGVIVIAKDITDQRTMERRLEADLSLARSLQERVLTSPIDNNQISIVGKYLPSMRLSGDMYCWYQIDENRYSVMLIDVMGHGVASSLICMSIRSLLPGLMIRVTEPIKVMKELNRHVFQLYNEKTYYFTAIYLVIDVNTRTIEYLNAGHPPAILFDANGTLQELDKGSIPLGITKNMDFEKGRVQLNGSSQLFLYTDGLLDVFGKNLKHCYNTLLSLYENNRELDNKNMIELIQERILIHKQEDDISFISIRIH